MEEANWDLLAVVRGCTSASAEPHAPPPATQQSPFPPSGFEDRHDLYKPFSAEDLKCPISSPADGAFYENQQQLVFHQVEEEAKFFFGKSRGDSFTTSTGASVFSTSAHTQKINLLCPLTTTSSSSIIPPTQQRSKKRKNLQKRVCHVPAEGLSSDMWAWRKYGQKPIKGSPYPRGYYRCSTSKLCLARKQVERNRSDPKMFIITYTSDHNHPMPTHRNSLAGSTRLKPPAAAEAAPPAASQGAAEKADIKAEHVEEMGNHSLEDMVMNDDFFVGFEELDDSDGGDLFAHQIQGNLEMGCPLNSSTTTTTTSSSGG